MRVLELPARLAYWGVPFRYVAGWENRGNEFPTRPDGVLRHWTGVGGEALNAIINGRPDLTGPLAQCYQSRQVDPATGLDIVYVVASGKANHAGEGVLNGISGNYKLLGLEIGWAGANEAFAPMRKLTSELTIRALLDCCLGDDPNDVGEHREYARPLGRKQDTDLSGDELRRRMTTITPYGDDMSAKAEAQINDMYTAFLSPSGNTGPGDPVSRASKVIDNAIWTKERLEEVEVVATRAADEAHAAALLAGNCNTMLDAIVKHLGIDLTPPADPSK